LAFQEIILLIKTTKNRPIALTIAGSDSGGGAGIQADLKTFHSFEVFGTSAITAITAQNTKSVLAVEVSNHSMIRSQIDAVCDDLYPDATKTGMLANTKGVRAVVSGVRNWNLTPLVVDPVMIATSGDRLLDPTSVDVMRTELLPLATIVTPNISEAEILSGSVIQDLDEMAVAAHKIQDSFGGAVLIKGGHMEGDEVIDFYWDGVTEQIWRAPRIHSTNTHGTGCTLSAAITAALATKMTLLKAVETGLSFTRAAIAAAPGLGSGRGPLDHWAKPTL